MSVKLALGMIVFNGMPFVEGVLKTLYPYVDQIVVAEGPVLFWHNQGHIRSGDGTCEMLADFPDPENKLSIVPRPQCAKDWWYKKLDMCNAWLGHVRDDITHVCCFDADEFMLREDIELVIALLEGAQYDSVGLRLYSFVGGFDRYLTGFEEKLEVIRVQPYRPGAKWVSHRPPTIDWPNKDLEIRRHLDWNALDGMGVRLYHYSHVLPSQVLAKEAYYGNYVGAKNVIADYYNRVWRPWVEGDPRVKRGIENLWAGIHDFHPNYRGEAFSAEFTGRHPWWIEQNEERILEIQRRQIEG